MKKRGHSDTKTRAKSSSAVTSIPRRLTLFGKPQLLEGEDAAAYDQLLEHICAVVKPIDIIDEMFTADVVYLEWQVLRWRRLKWNFLQARGLKKLEDFLPEQLDYDLYREYFEAELAEFLEAVLSRDRSEDARKLARESARGNPDAEDKVNKLLAKRFMSMKQFMHDARDRKAEELVQGYVRRESDAVTLIDELLTSGGKSMDTLIAEALAEELNHIERIDRLTAIAESRRNASLREIDRRRAVLGETLRRSVQEIEDAEFKVIETTPSKGKNAA
jgi:uncharacterized protein YjaG (DUF416 family)